MPLTHVLRVKVIFDGVFAVTVWTKEDDDLDVLGLSPPGEQLLLCEIVLRQYGKRALEELLGVRNREYGVAVEEELVFDQYHWADSDDEDNFGFDSLHIRDLVRVEPRQAFKRSTGRHC